MIEVICFIIISFIAFLTGRVFSVANKKNQMANCLVMLEIMTMSTAIGIIIAAWIPEIVLSTIISIFVSFALTIALTYRLPFQIMIEGFTMLFMGAMMGAMLRLMTTNYALLSLIFFTFVYVLSTIAAISLWHREQNFAFKKTVPLYLFGIAVIAIFILIGSAILGVFDINFNPAVEFIENHHH